MIRSRVRASSKFGGTIIRWRVFNTRGALLGLQFLKAASPEGVVVVLGFEPGTPLSGGVLSFGWFILQKTDFG